MMNKFKKIITMFFLAVMFTSLLSIIERSYLNYNSFSYDYFVENTLSEIGAKNIVTGIYLEYRLFDSLFEAGILLVVVAGVLFMNKKDNEIK